jgi:hypothetical protein
MHVPPQGAGCEPTDGPAVPFGVGDGGIAAGRYLKGEVYRMKGESMMQKREPLYLVCIDCGQEFVFPVSAQEYFEEKGYVHHPKRCKSCHNHHKRGDQDTH